MAGRSTSHSKKGARPEGPGSAGKPPADMPALAVNVIWGDITLADAHVYAVGHYEGVLPQWAERELDKKVSQWKKDDDRLLITDFTRRGVFRGGLGEIAFFPWDPDGKLVAVVGMGRAGTFGQPQLAAMARGLARSVGLIPGRTRLATVLIGSGDGNLAVAGAASGLLEGIINALREDPALRLDQLQIVERDLGRALEIVDSLTEFLGSAEIRPQLEGKLRLDFPGKLAENSTGGGVINPEFGCSLLLGALAEIDGDQAHSELEGSILKLAAQYFDALPKVLTDKFQQFKKDPKLAALSASERVRRLAMALRVRGPSDGSALEWIPTRVSFWARGADIYASAITNRVTVTERKISNRLPVVREEIERLTDPPLDEFKEDGAESLQRMLIHPDFRGLIGKATSLVIEVDPEMARVPWEMMPSPEADEPLGVATRIARQLRTPLAPRPDDPGGRRTFKILIVGDPDNSLPDARDEARALDKLLREVLGRSAVETLIGAPEDGTMAGPVKGYPPATYSVVFKGLQRGDYDIVHYCGHGLFDPNVPELSGWRFKHNTLTGADLEGGERPPILVVANACETARFGQSPQGDVPENDGGANDPPKAKARPWRDPRLLVSLADEFFSRGVSHYIGTAWDVPSGPAREFASEFYTRLAAGKRMGEAVKEARRKLWSKASSYGNEYGMAWAAYQHYGDPTATLDLKARGAAPALQPGGPPSASS